LIVWLEMAMAVVIADIINGFTRRKITKSAGILPVSKFYFALRNGQDA